MILFANELKVSEILDSELLGEGLIPTLQHAHDKLLVENPLTVPYRATIYGQVFKKSFIASKALIFLYGNFIFSLTSHCYESNYAVWDFVCLFHRINEMIFVSYKRMQFGTCTLLHLKFP